MGFFDFFKKSIVKSDRNIKHPANHDFEIIKPLYQTIVSEALRSVENSYATISYAKLSSYKELKSLRLEDKIVFIHYLIYLKGNNIDDYNSFGKPLAGRYKLNEIRKGLLSLLLRNIELPSDKDLLEIALGLSKGNETGSWYWPYLPFLSLLEKYKKQYGLTEILKLTLQASIIKKKSWGLSADDNRINIRIKEMILNVENTVRYGNDAIGSRIKELIKEDSNYWTPLFNHFKTQSAKSTPTQKWITQTSKLYEKEMEGELINWFDLVIYMLKEIHSAKQYQYDFLSELSIQQVRGAIWTCGIAQSEVLSNKLEELGLWCFKKLPGVGAVSVKLGNAVIYAFSILPFQEGIERLTKYRMKIKYRSVLSVIENTINRVAKKEGKSMDQLEEMSVSGFGLDSQYQTNIIVGECKAVIQIDSIHKVNLSWKTPTGKVQKSIPSIISSSEKTKIKETKAKVKEIQSSLSAQKDRLESYFIKKRSWTWKEWLEFYQNHPLVSFISRKLIWTFWLENKKQVAFYHEGQFVNPTEKISIDAKKVQKVALWHPIDSDVHEVEAWRNFLFNNEIQQPFKQAYREIYLVTDAEITTESYSNRFAAHILRQHQFVALCQQRHWRYTLMGQWDSHNIPSISIPDYDMHAEFWVEGDWDGSSANEMGVFNYVFTDQVRFYDRERQLNMQEVPPMVFSEIMRDVDLFVGVTSIGNDPNWTDSGNQRLDTYWSSASFQDLSESAKNRKQILERLTPKLKIKKVASFEKNYLIIKGKIRTYKIHIGSGNILMKPNDQYLCIVPDRKKHTDNLFLPFEGDNLLSIILSKAFLLADDDKITDKTILSQLRR